MLVLARLQPLKAVAPSITLHYPCLRRLLFGVLLSANSLAPNMELRCLLHLHLLLV